MWTNAVEIVVCNTRSRAPNVAIEKVHTVEHKDTVLLASWLAGTDSCLQLSSWFGAATAAAAARKPRVFGLSVCLSERRPNQRGTGRHQIEKQNSTAPTTTTLALGQIQFVPFCRLFVILYLFPLHRKSSIHLALCVLVCCLPSVSWCQVVSRVLLLC